MSIMNQAEIDNVSGQINTLRQKLAKKPKDVIVEKTVAKEVIVEKTVVKEVPIKSDYIVFFTKGSAELDDAAKKLLNKISAGTTVEVVGAADEVSSIPFNQQLSEKRANNVAKYLKNRKVNVQKVLGVGKTGSVVSRVAIVTVK